MPRFSDLRDDFDDNTLAWAWISDTTGSATVAETGGQVRFTLPSSTAGSHDARYSSRSAYDLTGDSWYINIQTMVATGVAATAFCQLYDISTQNRLQWVQVSNTIYARKIVAGVTTDLFSATWSASTYKYVRIRETGGNIEWHSSTNGTSWTLRATLAIPFAITELYIAIGASCGNVASPGSFRLDDVNLVLPALSTNWRWTQIVWPLTERFRTITIALDTAGTAQAYVALADDVDVSNDPVTPIYYTGPAYGGRELTGAGVDQAQAEAMAVNIPVDGRFDLPSTFEGRVIRVYHRSIDGSAYTLREVYPRRLVQADDIEAESIRALHIAASTISGDKITATFSITSKRIQTAYALARVVLSGETNGGFIGYGDTDTYDPVAGTGTYQVLWKLTDGKFYFGDGIGVLEDSGISLEISATSASDPSSYKFVNSSGTVYGGLYGYHVSNAPFLLLRVPAQAGETSNLEARAIAPVTLDATVTLRAQSSASNEIGLFVSANSVSGYTGSFFATSSASATWSFQGTVNIDTGLNVGTATGAAAGEVRMTFVDTTTATTVVPLVITHNSSSGTPAANFGVGIRFRLRSSSTNDRDAGQVDARWATATDASRKGRVSLFAADDTGFREGLRVETNGSAALLSFYGGGAVVKPTVTGSRGGNAALASLLTALAGQGLLTDSSSA